MEETVTISLKRYKELEEREVAVLKRKTIQSRVNYAIGGGYYLHHLDEKQCNKLLFDRISELEKDNDELRACNRKHLDAQYDLLKDKVKQKFTPKPWWKL